MNKIESVLFKTVQTGISSSYPRSQEAVIKSIGETVIASLWDGRHAKSQSLCLKIETKDRPIISVFDEKVLTTPSDGKGFMCLLEQMSRDLQQMDVSTVSISSEESTARTLPIKVVKGFLRLNDSISDVNLLQHKLGLLFRVIRLKEILRNEAFRIYASEKEFREFFDELSETEKLINAISQRTNKEYPYSIQRNSTYSITK